MIVIVRVITRVIVIVFGDPGERGERGFHKRLYLASIMHSCRRLMSDLNVPVVLVGDLNVAYAARDVPQDQLGGLTKEDPDHHWARRNAARRVVLEHLSQDGAVDCFRQLHPHAMDAFKASGVMATVVSESGSIHWVRTEHVELLLKAGFGADQRLLGGGTAWIRRERGIAPTYTLCIHY